MFWLFFLPVFLLQNWQYFFLKGAGLRVWNELFSKSYTKFTFFAQSIFYWELGHITWISSLDFDVSSQIPNAEFFLPQRASRNTNHLQIMGHLAIYLDRNLDPPRVAHYSDPVPLSIQEKGWTGGRPSIWTVVSARCEGGLLFGPTPSQNPDPLLGGGFQISGNLQGR